MHFKISPGGKKPRRLPLDERQMNRTFGARSDGCRYSDPKIKDWRRWILHRRRNEAEPGVNVPSSRIDRGRKHAFERLPALLVAVPAQAGFALLLMHWRLSP